MIRKCIAALLVAGALTISCSKISEQKEEISLMESSVRELTITATVEGGATRTSFDEGTRAVLWSPGDAISVFYGSGTSGGSEFVSTATESAAVSNFTGTISVITGGADIAPEDTYFWGVYPYSPLNTCDGTSVTLSVPTEQTAAAGTFAPGHSPSLGRSQGLTMGFYNVCGGLKFSVTKEGIKRVTLRGNGSEEISGTVRVGIAASGLPEVLGVSGGSDIITLSAPEGEYFEVGQYYYIMMLPTVFTSGFSLTLETFTESAEVTVSSSVTITRSQFGRLSNVDSKATYEQKTGNIPVPDANFKTYLVEHFDTDSDGEISYEEALAITEIDVYTDNIYSLHGIEYCKNLSILRCEGHFNGNLASLDVSNNELLTELSCGYNQLASLDMSNNVSLTALHCGHNQLTSLDVSNCAALTYLNCDGNQLTSLDVSNNTALTSLSCLNNQLTSLDVSNNTLLTNLSCSSNQLTSLDVSNCTALTSLSCSYNQITSLDVSNNTELSKLYCNYNQLTSLDVSNNIALNKLSCRNNQLTSLDISNNPALTYLDCYQNQLNSLDVSNCTALEVLDCRNNQLASLDVSDCAPLTDLYCYNNQLTSLNLSNNASLTVLFCYNNQLTSLDVSNCAALTYLYCNDNQLTSLDVSDCAALTYLYCDENQLISLDVSNCAALTYLYCDENQLTSLDVSNNVALTDLHCSPMNDVNGNNLLGALYIAEGQSIPNVTENRNTDYIPEATQIVVRPAGGGGEGFGEIDIL